MTRRARIVVRGFVQGVFFRYSAKEKADELRLVGTVRNAVDGSVEIVCEGEDGQIERLIAWSRRGPSTARIDAVDVAWEEPTGALAGFRIVH